MEVILDSSFIISCIRKRIDFIEQLTGQGFKVVVPREVLQELKDVRNKSKTSHEDRIAIEVALTLLNTKSIKKVSFGEGKVDDFLIKKGKEGVHIATLDAGIKRQVPRRVVIFDAQKSVGVDNG